MNRASAWIAWGIVVGATVGVGWLHGRLINRWGVDPKLIEAGDRLSHIPDRVGEWQQTSSRPLAAGDREMLECTGEIVRTYVHQGSGATVNVALLVGPAGPMAVHTPEICYHSRNHTLLAPRARTSVRDVNDTEHELWTLAFRSPDLQARTMRVYYGWSTGGPWRAPDAPRFEFAGRPYLYKIQATCYQLRPSHSLETDELQEFLQYFLPQADTAMMRTSTP